MPSSTTTALPSNAITIDPNNAFKNSFTKLHSKGMYINSFFCPGQLANSFLDAVYFTGSDPLLGPLIIAVYKDSPDSSSLSTILVGRHGISEHVNMTIGPKSRFFGACLNLPKEQQASMVRKAMAIACLRTFSGMEIALKSYLTFSSSENQLFDWDETTAGALAASMKPATARFPVDIGNAILDSGALLPKFIKSTVVDIVYQDSPQTNDYNNELVYLFGHQLEHLFDPLAEYSPEHTEMLYTPPSYPPMPRTSDVEAVQHVYQELFNVQHHFTANLLSLLEDYLIPLRVKVLGGGIPGMTMRKLNMIFPPTIDEIVRVNNIFYEALTLALPYGSYEVVKACGISIPYFYKACMRHEAATRNFRTTLRENYDLIQIYGPVPHKYSINNIESTIHCSLHLTKIKLVLDRLVKVTHWREDERVNVDELYQSAVGTIDSFGRESFISPYNNRIFTPTGKILVEISKGWPKELEYGWINRRIVTIFDAVDTMHGDPTLFSIVFIFTDAVVVIRPTEPINIVSESGIHKPSITDILMHSMINSVPLPNLPGLEVVGWAPIEDVYMAEFGDPKNLAMYITGSGLNCDHDNDTAPAKHLALFKLIRPEVTANDIVNYTSKAKIMNKTQPFHLFLNTHSELSTFGTVYELDGYLMEPRKCPVAIYANMDFPESILESHDLIACIGVQVDDGDRVAITVLSKLAYKYHDVVSKSDFAAALSTQVSRVYGLYFASSNPFATEMIIKNNSDIANHLINFSTTRPDMTPKNHKRLSARVEKEPVAPASELVKRKPSLRQRVSTASSLFKKTGTPSPSVVQPRVMAPQQEPKKRFSLPFIFGREKVKVENSERNKRALSTISLPIEHVSERPQDPQNRFSFPPQLASPQQSMQQSTPTKSTMRPSPRVQVKKPSSTISTPSHIAPAVMSPAQKERLVKRKTSFSAAQSPPIPYLRNAPSHDIISVDSSVVKDSERFWDSLSASSIAIDPATESTPVKEHFLETIRSEPSSDNSISNLAIPEHAVTVTYEHSLTTDPSIVVDSFSGTHSSASKSSTCETHTASNSIGQSSLGQSVWEDEEDDGASSVENWYNELHANGNHHRVDSLNSSASEFESGPDCTQETTLDDDDDDIIVLEVSLKNITSFLDEDTPPTQLSHQEKPFQFPSKPYRLPELSSESVLDSNFDDFSYLTSLVTGAEEQAQVPSSASLYSGIRDSSLVHLGTYIQGHDNSVSRLDHMPSTTTLGTKSSRSQAGGPRHANRHRREISVLSSEWKSISDSYSFQSLALSQKSIRHVTAPVPQSTNRDPMNMITSLGQQSARYAGGEQLSSLTSFANFTEADIQLRSLTVNVDSLINQECAELMNLRNRPDLIEQRRQRVMNLERLNQTVLRLHQSTHSLSPLPASVTQLEDVDQARVVAVEHTNRKILIKSLWGLIGDMVDSRSADQYDRYKEAFTGFLNLEWERRTAMHTKLGNAMPQKMWSV